MKRDINELTPRPIESPRLNMSETKGIETPNAKNASTLI